MSIADFNHYTPLGSDPKLSRNYATKKDVERLQEQIDKLNKTINILLNSKEMEDNNVSLHL
jgi:tetrahydromethanopterin S-methyltransferase subunit B|tara:strand:+ start:608 stop:790 length:183 start_codon:yes stop_codon:yes gene_type:complete